MHHLVQITDEYETERLIVKKITTKFVDEFSELITDYRKNRNSIYDREWRSEYKYLETFIEQKENNYSFFVFLKDNNKLIGHIGLMPDVLESNHFGYCLNYIFHSNFHNKGYATESCISLIDIGFENMKEKYFLAGTAKVNYKSCKLLERIGFSKYCEKEMSFQKDSKNQEIVFIGSIYKLTKVEWDLIMKCEKT